MKFKWWWFGQKGLTSPVSSKSKVIFIFPAISLTLWEWTRKPLCSIKSPKHDSLWAHIIQVFHKNSTVFHNIGNDQVTRWADDQVTRWPDDQITRLPDYLMTYWPDDQMTRWPDSHNIDQITRLPDDHLTRCIDEVITRLPDHQMIGWLNDQRTILTRCPYWPDE